MKLTLLQAAAVVATFFGNIYAVTHMPNLLWTEKDMFNGIVNVKGIPGDPYRWVEDGITEYAYSYFSDPYLASLSHRVALAFDYAQQELVFSDRGFKSIYRVVLQVAPTVPYVYYMPLYAIYDGISTEVNGMAMDWASGSLYWTDALYGWITVARADTKNVFNHIVSTGVDQPWGIAVYPQKGWMFWSDIGAVCKIERARLDGTGRTIFVVDGVDKPLGLTIDYDEDHLYWVDDFRHSIERIDIDTRLNRVSIFLDDIGIFNSKLFGISNFKDYVFFAEQTSMSIVVMNKTSLTRVESVNAAIFNNFSSIPFDVLMYDSNLQDNFDSDCNFLQCSDICISDGGRAAHCICRTGYSLNTTNNVTCYKSSLFEKPQFIYSVGGQLCGASVIVADVSVQSAAQYVRCFLDLPDGQAAFALGFHVYANLLFFSDEVNGVISRLRLESNDLNVVPIAANTGSVHGIAVDWIADNLYWTNGQHGYIMVSRLDGRFPKLLITNLDEPRAIVVNPLSGTMYWVSSNETVYAANMDGTNIRVIVHLVGSQLDGMVLDIDRDRIYIVDKSLPGIRTMRPNGTDLRTSIVTRNSVFHDVTVYEDYFAWTTGQSYVYFGVQATSNTTITSILRGIVHYNQQTSHDIITYDTYLQPSLGHGQINPCDIDDDNYGCSQLCLLVPNLERRCNCSYGFYRAPDERKCLSDPVPDNFLLFTDPLQKTMYQIDLAEVESSPNGLSTVQGISLLTSNYPVIVGYSTTSKNFYWHGHGTYRVSIKMKSFYNLAQETTLTTFAFDEDVGVLEVIPSIDRVVFTDVESSSLYAMDASLTSIAPNQLSAAVNVLSSALTVEPYTTDVYWIEVEESSSVTTQSIRTCKVENCITRENSRLLLNWDATNNSAIVGLTVALGPGSGTRLTFWTQNVVYQYNSTDGSVERLAEGTSSSNFTKVVVVDNVVYFVDWNLNYVFKINITSDNQSIIAITDPAFSRLTDLKVYRSQVKKPEVVTLPVADGSQHDDSILSPQALYGIIAAGAAIVFLLLLLILVLLILSYRRRRRRQQQSYKTPAHANPTYMTLPPGSPTATASPVDVNYVVGDEATGVTFAFDFEDEEKKKVPITDVDDNEKDLTMIESGASGLGVFTFESYDKKKEMDEALGGPPSYDFGPDAAMEPHHALPLYDEVYHDLN